MRSIPNSENAVKVDDALLPDQFVHPEQGDAADHEPLNVTPSIQVECANIVPE